MTLRHAMRSVFTVVSLIIATGCSTMSPYKGEWHSAELTGGIKHEVTAMYLDLNADGTFSAQFEGPDARGALSGTYEIVGKRLDLHHEEFENWSFRFVDDTLRANGGGSGIIVLQRLANP